MVYALTRKSGITPQLPPPTWMPDQRPVAMVQEAPLAIDIAVADELLFDDLDAWLALVLAPIGSEDHRGISQCAWTAAIRSNCSSAATRDCFSTICPLVSIGLS